MAYLENHMDALERLNKLRNEGRCENCAGDNFMLIFSKKIVVFPQKVITNSQLLTIMHQEYIYSHISSIIKKKNITSSIFD